MSIKNQFASDTLIRWVARYSSNHLAKESPRNDGRMKDSSEEALVLPEELTEQFFGKHLRKTLDWKRTEDAFQLEGALAP
jgi:hypothetical protein